MLEIEVIASVNKGADAAMVGGTSAHRLQATATAKTRKGKQGTAPQVGGSGIWSGCCDVLARGAARVAS